MKRLLFLLLLTFVFSNVSAQMNPNDPLPIDPAVRKGVLENGMTYYIRHNEKPKGNADFYIVHNVGAIQEEDSQQGLAHFLEHMAFNGTKNLPGKSMIEYLETIGVKFGANLNAATSWDFTMYNICDVPVKRQGIIDSVMLILHDWSHFIALQPKEIDSERGVIMEELRTRDGADWRSTMNMLKAIGKGTLYEHRNLIGYLDDLKSFQHKELEAFYKKWYRPDYQTVVIVGDIDVDAVEAGLKKLMADIPAPAADAAKKDVIVVPENKEPIISVFTDKEMQGSSAMLTIKHETIPSALQNTLTGIQADILKDFANYMVNERLSEIGMKPNAPFIQGSFGIGGIGVIPTLEGVIVNVVTEDGKLLPGIESIYTELERIKRHGFTAGEFERAQKDLLRSAEKSYNNRNDRTNGSHVMDCISNYRDNTPILDPETEWQLDQQLLKLIPLDVVNQMVKAMITAENQVMVINAPEKDGIKNPTSEEVLAIREKAMKSEVEAYKDNVVIEPLIAPDEKLQGSSIVGTKTDPQYNTTEWTLSNGAKVVLKSTKFKADELKMNAYAFGGLSRLTVEDVHMGQILPAINAMSGVGKFSMNELSKQLSGKSASVQPFITNYENGMVGNCSPKDVETMLQLTYLNFTKPRFNRDDYNSVITMVKSQFSNAATDPSYQFQKAVRKAMYGDNPRSVVLSQELIDRFSFEKLPLIYNTLFPGVNGFTFIFVGNIEADTLKPLVEKYIGSIPGTNKPLEFKDDQLRLSKGIVKEEISVPMQQPKVSVFYNLNGKAKYSLKEKLTLDFLVEALNARYLISIREEKGGTYGVGVSSSLSLRPEKGYNLFIQFDTNEKMADELMDIIIQEIKTIAQNGPVKEDIEKHREFLIKSWNNSLEDNSSWMRYIKTHLQNSLNYMAEYEGTVKAITYQDIQKMARKILKDKNMIHVIMHPGSAK